jgi:hypothetical protein
VKELADRFGIDIQTMTGFLDGINDSLKVKNPIETMEEDTPVSLAFDKEMLYRNMVDAKAHWLSFAYAIPVSMLVWLVFNATWFNRRRNYLIISLMMWTLITVLHLSLLMFGHNIWHFYLLGVPGQLIIILWSIIGKKN